MSMERESEGGAEGVEREGGRKSKQASTRIRKANPSTQIVTLRHMRFMSHLLMHVLIALAFLQYAGARLGPLSGKGCLVIVAVAVISCFRLLERSQLRIQKRVLAQVVGDDEAAEALVMAQVRGREEGRDKEGSEVGGGWPSCR